MMKNASLWVVLARLLRPQGRKGELLAELFTDLPERFTTNPHVFLASPGFDGDFAQARDTEIVSFWMPVGRNEGRIVLQFAGIDSISAAEGLASLEVVVPDEDRPALEEDAVYIRDLTGCTLFDGEKQIGIVTDVEFALTPDGTRRLDDAAPLLHVSSGDGDEILVPFAKAYLVSIDTQAKRIEMTLPEGLVELNRTE